MTCVTCQSYRHKLGTCTNPAAHSMGQRVQALSSCSLFSRAGDISILLFGQPHLTARIRADLEAALCGKHRIISPDQSVSPINPQLTLHLVELEA
jgi:hypothetical protein